MQPTIIPSTLVYHHFCLEDLWLLFILVSDTQSTPITAHEKLPKFCDWKPIRLLGNKLPELKTLKIYPLFKCFLVDNEFGIELPELQWNMSYWNEKDGRFSFETQLKI